MNKAPKPNEDNVKYKIYNIGNNSPESLMDFVTILEQKLVKGWPKKGLNFLKK